MTALSNSNPMPAVPESSNATMDNWRRIYQNHVSSGALDRAEKLVLSTLQQFPAALGSWKNLAADLVEYQTLLDAEPIFNALVKTESNSASVHFYLGMIAHHRQQVDKAIDHLQNAAKLRPDWPEVQFNLGTFYQEKSLPGNAIEYYKKALSLKPNWVAALTNQGVALMELDQYADARHCFYRAQQIDTSDSHAFFFSGILFQRMNDNDSAIADYKQAVQREPGLVQAHINLGNCYVKADQYDKAVQSFRHALSLDPNSAEAWFSLASAIQPTGTIDDILTCYRKAVTLKPDWDAAHYNLAVTFRKKKCLPEAIYHSLQALKLSPQYDKAWINLLMVAQHACDWNLLTRATRHVDRITSKELQTGRKTSEDPMLSLRRHVDPPQNLKIAHSWSRSIAHEVTAFRNRPAFHHLRKPSQRIRIGYLSNDFKDHAVAHQIRGMLATHDRKHFKIYGYACNPDDGTRYRRFIAQACDCFIDIHDCSNLSAAQRIYDDRIDILVDLSGHTFGNRLQIAALRPAAVQVSYLGFLGSTGASFIDYVITDPLVVPETDATCYTEKPAYLPNCYQANDDQLPIADVNVTRDMFNLPSEGFIYCCFNQPYKIEPHLFDIWMKILRSVDNSVLWLLHRSQLSQDNLRRAAAGTGISPDRLIFSALIPLEQHLARLQLADLALDTYTYNGGATTSNALWAGVPVLASLGQHWVSRMSASALHAIGLPELVTANLDEYRQMAVDLAHKPSRLKALREKLAYRRQEAPLFNTKLFTTHLEKAYLEMWRRYRHNLAPASFHVQP